jgi:hypothetical protein
MEAQQKAARDWATFALGKWTRDPPTKPGKYATATVDGFRDSDILVIQREGKLVALAKGQEDAAPKDVWVGWWWTKPYPELPPAPKGETKR